ncbi:hypothetical protein JHK86_043426 [Glycine max]|nr:hypothetical protein JHK86_043426 [Glycine max]
MEELTYVTSNSVESSQENTRTTKEFSNIKTTILYQSAEYDFDVITSSNRKLVEPVQKSNNVAAHDPLGDFIKNLAMKTLKITLDGKSDQVSAQWIEVVESESYSSDGVHELELLLSFLNDSSIEACSQGDVVGILLFSGLTDSFAYLNSKEPISQAVTDIKGDIITSLQSRLYIICDEVDVDSGNKYYVQNQVSNEISAEKPVPQLVLHLLG